jgi:hypothetical protein
MSNHYPPADELADAVLPFRWQVATKADAERLVSEWHGSPEVLGIVLHAVVSEALWKRRPTDKELG